MKEEDKEVRVWWQGGLVCPNPREYTKMTRAYEDMRAEYNLLHCGEYTEEEKQQLEEIIMKNRSILPMVLLCLYGPLLTFIILEILYLYFNK